MVIIDQGLGEESVEGKVWSCVRLHLDTKISSKFSQINELFTSIVLIKYDSSGNDLQNNMITCPSQYSKKTVIPEIM